MYTHIHTHTTTMTMTYHDPCKNHDIMPMNHILVTCLMKSPGDFLDIVFERRTASETRAVHARLAGRERWSLEPGNGDFSREKMVLFHNDVKFLGQKDFSIKIAPFG